MAGATETIATFISRTSLADLPPDAPEKAAKAIADTFAVILAGAGSEVTEPLLRYARTAGESGVSPILGTGMTATAEMAALVNGTFGHALDYDDVLAIMPAHPSTIILSAVLASLKGERVSGKAFIEAYVLGIEIGGKIGLGMTQGHYRRGFHATGTLALILRARCAGEAAPSRRPHDAAGIRHRRLDGERPAAQFRHDDQAAAQRHRGPQRADRAASRAVGL